MNPFKAMPWKIYLLATISGVCGNTVLFGMNKLIELPLPKKNRNDLEIYKWEKVDLNNKNYEKNSWQAKVIKLFELQEQYNDYELYTGQKTKHMLQNQKYIGGEQRDLVYEIRRLKGDLKIAIIEDKDSDPTTLLHAFFDNNVFVFVALLANEHELYVKDGNGYTVKWPNNASTAVGLTQGLEAKIGRLNDALCLIGCVSVVTAIASLVLLYKSSTKNRADDTHNNLQKTF